MTGSSIIKLLALIALVAIVDVVVFSPGFVGLDIGGSALSTAFGATLLVASAIALIAGSYSLLNKQTPAIPVKSIQTPEDYEEALGRYRKVRAVENDIAAAMEQFERLKRKKATLEQVLLQRFDPGELSYKKFDSVVREVEKLFYLNVRSVLNRLNVFDEAEYERVMRAKPSARLSPRLLQEKTALYEDFIAFVKGSLAANEEILLKLDKLLLEISRLDSFEPGDIEAMACMQEIDALIKQTKFYKQ